MGKGYLIDLVEDIGWNKRSKKNLKLNDFEDLLKSLDRAKRIKERHTMRSSYKDGSWFLRRKGFIREVFLKKDGEYLHFWSSYDNHKNYCDDHSNTGRKAIQKVADMFYEKNKVTLKTAFGYSPREVSLICSPKQFYYTNKDYFDADKDWENISSADFTSHYPGCVEGDLPDWHTAKEVPGTVKPTKEYPFAFYIKSGHIAEYGVFDTHNWINSKFSFDLFYNSDVKENGNVIHYMQNYKKYLTNPDSDLTILCKSSKYHLDDIYGELFLHRKENEEYKNAMNKSIGYMATKSYKSYRLAHIRAIILGRANAKMLKIAEQLYLPSIVQICVDGIIYQGKSAKGINEKIFGTLHQEFTEATGRFRALNCYIIKKDGEIIKSKHASLNACDGDGDIDHPKSMDDIKLWYRTPFIGDQDDI